MQVPESVGSLSQKSLLAVIWTSFGLAFLFVVMRIAIRLRFMARLAIEDYWIFLALTTLLTSCILQTIQLPSLYYLLAIIAGVVPVSVDLISATEKYLRFEFAIMILFWTILWCVKASFLALYFKLFRELRIYRRVWYTLAAFTLLAYVGCCITLATSCHPISNFFKFEQCNTKKDIWASRFSVYYSTAIDIFTDLCMMAMPVKLIYNLQISLKQKAGLVCVFSLCFVMIVFAVIRAKQVLVDQYFVNLVLLETWSTLASSISVIVGCLPAFKSLITNRTGTRHSNHGSGSTSKPKPKNNSKLRRTSIPLDSFSKDIEGANMWHPNATNSQQEMAKQDSTHAITIRNDVSVTSMLKFGANDDLA
ncbi:hypothetical protein D0Z07_2442 [Hyphodiscus hymeniophilus]|uniref:Rhodopsin domain-containing protein n=1 Tax=Hyphodiscus hymeniophilus TaxID=353542 RepID=A0A9P6VNR6_9HELO|nr:hypothetical protein D0Z07_2442 [Hyphodiscus hymeniophilus]